MGNFKTWNNNNDDDDDDDDDDYYYYDDDASLRFKEIKTRCIVGTKEKLLPAIF